MGFMSKPSAPPAPDYAAAATAQGAANKETAIAQFQLNNGNQITPYGTRTLTGNPADPGSFTTTTELNPADQARLDQTRALQSQLLGVAPNLLNNAYNQIATPVSATNLPPMSYGVDTGGNQQLNLSGVPGLGSPDDVRNQVENAAFSKFYDRFSPMAAQQQASERARVANMGGVTTSDAARRDMGALLTNQGDQFRNAVFDSILQGGNAAQQQFGMNLQAHQQGVSDTAQQTGFNNTVNQQDIQNAFANANLANQTRAQGLTEQSALSQMPLNQLLAMMSGTQVNQPQFQNSIPSNIAPTPIFDAATAQGQYAQNAYGQQLGSFNNILGAIGGLGGAAIGAPKGTFSDRRLKSNIVLVGATPKGIPLYEYDIFGHRERGVMAQDLLQVKPEAVLMHPSGYLMVDYAQVE